MSKTSESIKVTGSVVIKNEVTGEILYTSTNMVVNGGKFLIANRIAGLQSISLRAIGIGTGDAPTTPSTTSLTTPVGTRVPIQTITVGTQEPTITCVGYILQNNPNVIGTTTIKELGLFTSTTGGILFARMVIGSGIPKLNTDVLSVRWNIRIE